MLGKGNPYRPGAGLQPVYLAGRDQIISDINSAFQAVNVGIPVQSVIVSGLRGVGKTVLINRLEEIAKEQDIFCKHIEIEDRKDFISQIASCVQLYLREVRAVQYLKESMIRKTMDAIKSLVISFDPNEQQFSVSIKESELDLYRVTNLTQGLTEVFVSVGELAQKAKKPICFFVDEMQYMKSAELGSLIAALHRTNQLGYPVLVVGAGLPKIYKMLSDEKSYSERLFSYVEIGSLGYQDCCMAISEPAEKMNVHYSEAAKKLIFQITGGYPFYIQQLCNLVYEGASGNEIRESDVEQVLLHYYQVLDTGFFKVRYERCSEGDKKFIFAMVACGELPCTIANVAANLHKSVTSISPTRAQLINKGIIYAVRYKELDFTVPQFSAFIERQVDYQNWYKDNIDED